MWFSVRKVFLFLLVLGCSQHFPITQNKHLPFEHHNNLLVIKHRKVQVGKDQEKAQSEREPHIGADFFFFFFFFANRSRGF